MNKHNMARRWDFILVTSVTAFVSFWGIMANQLINVTTYNPFHGKAVKIYSYAFLRVCYYGVNEDDETESLFLYLKWFLSQNLWSI